MPGEGRFRVDFVSNIEIVAQGFFMTREKLETMIEPMTKSAEVVARAIDDNFEQEGGWAGPWAPLATATVQRKERLGLDPRILRATGALHSAVTSGSAWAIAQTNTNTAVGVLHDPTSYGHFHLSGTRFMPMRDWASVDDDTLDQIEQIFQEWINEAFAVAGV